MFGIIPKPLWERRIAPDERNRIPLHMRCLLLEGEGRLILIDTGLGHKYDEKFRDIYAVDHATCTLEASLRQAGFEVSEVTDVILTHLHFDHAGGATQRTGDRLEVAFPHARFHVQRRHWDWALHPNPRERGSFLKENLEPLAASGQLELVDGDVELFPGVQLLTVHGHTEAQQLVRISDRERTLLFAADLVPTTAHLGLPWVMAYDVRPLVTVEEKQRLLEEAVTGGWDLFFEHDPEVAVASLERTPKGVAATEARSLDEW